MNHASVVDYAGYASFVDYAQAAVAEESAGYEEKAEFLEIELYES